MCLMACLVIVNFRFETSKEDIGGLSPKYNLFIAILLSALGLGCFIVSGISYMQSLHGYKHQKVTTYDSRYTTGYLIILCTALLGVNIAFLIEGWYERYHNSGINTNKGPWQYWIAHLLLDLSKAAFLNAPCFFFTTFHFGASVRIYLWRLVMVYFLSFVLGPIFKDKKLMFI